MKEIRIVYDFDGTLCPKFMQEYGLTEALGYDNSKDCFNAVNEFIEKHDMDLIIGALCFIQQKAKERNIKVTKEWFASLAKNVEFFDGVENYFTQLNEYGKSKGVNIEHYIISSGHKEIIDATPIAKFFKVIYASFYAYKNGEAFYTAQAINSNNKVQFLYRIHKNAFGYLDDSLNQLMEEENCFPFKNMVYIGDGYTDIPCMQVTKSNGGKSIVVYNPNSNKSKESAEQIFKDGRVDFKAKADYSESGELFDYLKKLIDEISTK